MHKTRKFDQKSNQKYIYLWSSIIIYSFFSSHSSMNQNYRFPCINVYISKIMKRKLIQQKICSKSLKHQIFLLINYSARTFWRQTKELWLKHTSPWSDGYKGSRATQGDLQIPPWTLRLSLCCDETLAFPHNFTAVEQFCSANLPM